MHDIIIRYTEGVPNNVARAIAKLHNALKKAGMRDFTYEVVLGRNLIAGSTQRHHVVTPKQNKEALCTAQETL